MNWSSVASNQCFSYNTLQNAVTNNYFVLKNTIPASTKMVNKTEVEFYVFCIVGGGRTANQLVVKSSVTSSYGTWIFTNVSCGDIDISGMTSPVNTVTSGAFPSTPGTTIQGYCNAVSSLLTFSFVTSYIADQYIKVTDSNGTVQTAYFPIGYAAGYTYPSNVVINTSVPLQILAYCTTPDWVSQGYYTCGYAYDSTCNNYLVYRDVNPYSTTYNNYKVNGVNVGATAPANGVCNTAATWINVGFSCYSTCNKYNVELDNNPCSATYNTTQQGSLVETNSTYCGGCCGQSTVATWTSQAYNTCSGCVTYLVYRDTNSCSPTYNNYQVNGIDVGASAPSNGSCSTTPNWVNTSFSCYATCDKYNVQTDTNPCSPTYNTTQQGSLVEANSTYCGGCCGQSTAPNWVNRNINTYWVCVGVDQYYEQIDTNSCSPTYNTTQTGSLYLANAAVCGYVPPTVYSGDVWFGTSPSSGFDQACDLSSPNLYLYWSGAQLFYPGLVLYTDSALSFVYTNPSGYTYCSSDASGGGFDEYTLSGATLGSWTGTTC
jgi:hypothetical protein